MSFSTLIRALVSFLVLVSIRAMSVGTNQKIVSGQLSLEEVQKLYSDRINPVKGRINLRASTQPSDAQSRQKRDTLLSLYRQKQLYQNLNRNLYQAYFPAGETSAQPTSLSSSSRSSSGGSNSNFKKVVTNPYRDYQKSKASRGNIRPVYKKHHGFHVTDSVNHLKYLVPKPNPEPSASEERLTTTGRGDSADLKTQPEPVPRAEDDSAQHISTNSNNNKPNSLGRSNSHIRSRSLASNSHSQDNFDEEPSGSVSRAPAQSTRMRRGDFHPGKPTKDASRAFLDRLRAKSLRL